MQAILLQSPPAAEWAICTFAVTLWVLHHFIKMPVVSQKIQEHPTRNLHHSNSDFFSPLECTRGSCIPVYRHALGDNIHSRMVTYIQWIPILGVSDLKPFVDSKKNCLLCKCWWATQYEGLLLKIFITSLICGVCFTPLDILAVVLLAFC